MKTEEIERIKLVIDPELLPETAEFFENSILTDMDPYELADEIVQCDRTADMPKELFDFVVGLYLEAIDRGNANAMNDLGALYYDGRGCEQDFTKAVHYYHMAAQNGSSQAQENLGYCYYYGRNMPVDYEKAFRYFALGAFRGRLISLYKIGDMYRNGFYVEKDPKEAFGIYIRCLDLMTDEAAATVAGPVYLRVGTAFLTGEGVDADPKKALVAFQRAELFLYDMVSGGDAMYKKSLQAAIDGQLKARAMLAEALPKQEWTAD
ncbi:MAG: sel1 repeat family protein [Clostridia bacterium]|nr:sel1 repeat family protein [Clostridia bacterium]